MRTYIEGTVNAVIQYCLPVYGNSWGVDGGHTEGHRTLCTKDDITRLQVLQNKAMRCLIKRRDGTFWETLARMGAETLSNEARMMTVNQMIAVSTLVMTRRMIDTKKPKYVVDRMWLSDTRHNSMMVRRPSSHQLKLTGEGFLERASRL